MIKNYNPELSDASDHSPYRALAEINARLADSGGTFLPALLEKYPQYNVNGIFCVDDHVPLFSSEGISWLPYGVLVMYPDITHYLTTMPEFIVKTKEGTPLMQQVAAELMASEFFQMMQR